MKTDSVLRSEGSFNVVSSQSFLVATMSKTKSKLARLCMFGVIKPEEYFQQCKIRKKKTMHIAYSRSPFCISKFPDDEFKLSFRFTKSELARLTTALNIQRTYALRSRVRFTGEEGLCILLRRLAYPNRLWDLVPTFNRDATAISGVFNFMLNLVYVNFAQKLAKFKQLWLTQTILEEFSEACTEVGSPYPNIVGFIDGTCRPICRPTYNQRDLYSGYKKSHVVKYQSTVFPNGLIGRLDGPFIGRRHDSAILHLSKILDEMQELFVNDDGTHFAVFGDPGYSNQKYIKVGFKNQDRLSQEQKQFNRDLSALRVSVEYGFGQIMQQFAYLDFKKNQKLYGAPIKKQYYVAALLSNCQTCLRGNQISKYFNCSPPTLEEYLVQ